MGVFKVLNTHAIISFSVRLNDGTLINSNIYYGTPAVNIDGMLNTILGTNFTENDARVVCRELGYMFSKRLPRFSLMGVFSRTGMCISQLNCTGTEMSIFECDLSHQRCVMNFNDIEDAAVLCSTTSVDDSKHSNSHCKVVYVHSHIS